MPRSEWDDYEERDLTIHELLGFIAQESRVWLMMQSLVSPVYVGIYVEVDRRALKEAILVAIKQQKGLERQGVLFNAFVKEDTYPACIYLTSMPFDS